MKIFGIILSVAYILFEIAFRIKFLDVVGVSTNNPETISNLELIGRTISSIGFSILIAGFLSKKEIEKLKKTGLIVVSFFVFFVFQKLLLDNIANRLPLDEKEAAFFLELEKTTIFNLSNSGEYNNVNKDGILDGADKSLFITYPLTVGESKLFGEEHETNADYILVYTSSVVDNNTNIYFAQRDALESNLMSYYYQYEKLSKTYSEKISSIDSDVNKLQMHLKYSLVNDFIRYRQDVLSHFIYNARDLGNSRNEEVKLSELDKKGEYKDVFGNEKIIFTPMTIEAFLYPDTKYSTFNSKGYLVRQEYTLSDFEKYRVHYFVQKEDDIDIFKKKFTIGVNSFSGYADTGNFDGGFYSIITKVLGGNSVNLLGTSKENFLAKSCGRKNGVDFKHVEFYLNGKRERNVKIDFNGEYKFNYCNLDSLMAIAHKEAYKDAVKSGENYGFKRDIFTFTEFAKTDHARTIISKELSHRGITLERDEYIDIFNTIKLKSKALEFLDIQFLERKNKLANLFLGKNVYSEESGNNVKIKLGLNVKEFFNVDFIKTKLQKEYPDFYDGDKIMFFYPSHPKLRHLDREGMNNEYLNHVKLVMYKKLLNTYYQIKNGDEIKDELNVYAKSMIIPPFVLMISSIMIVLNIVNLGVSFIQHKRVKTLVYITGISLFVIRARSRTFIDQLS